MADGYSKTLVAGNGESFDANAEPGPATKLGIGSVISTALYPDGSFLISSNSSGGVVLFVDKNGKMKQVTGAEPDGGQCGQTSSSRQANKWNFCFVGYVATLANGSLLFNADGSDESGWYRVNNKGMLTRKPFGSAILPPPQIAGLAPGSIASYPDGTVLTASVFTGGHFVESISPKGKSRIVAGGVQKDDSGDAGPATKAGISATALATLPNGGFLIAQQTAESSEDTTANRVRAVSPSGIITTIAGTGKRGNNGDGDLATKADISDVQQMVALKDGSIILAVATGENSRAIRRIDLSGKISTILRPKGKFRIAGNPERNSFLMYTTNQVFRIEEDASPEE